jgi:hypothetical protein
LSRQRSILYLPGISILCSGLLVAAATLLPCASHAQALPTATQTMALSGFGGVTGTLTGLDDQYGSGEGKNLGITAGVNLRIGHFFGFLPSVEVRGTYPAFHRGPVDAQKDILGGIKIERPLLLPRLHVYGDFLYGRGEIDYESGGYYTPDQNFLYAYTVTNVLSPGVGLDYDLSHHFAVKADVQLQHWSTPLTTSGSIWAKPLTAAVIYRFDFNHRAKQLPRQPIR